MANKNQALIKDAIGELLGQKLRTFLTLLGMIFGVGAVIAMLNIGEGAEREALKLIDSMGVNNIIINGKKIKIKKRLEIKVPKNATFKLNTRHCKVKLPKTKASGKVSYGTFNAETLNGGELNISYSPVTINSINTTNLFLNNVTDAHIASVANSKLNANSSKLIVDNVYENVIINTKFGELTISKIQTNYDTFHVGLNLSEANINMLSIKQNLNYTIEGKSHLYPNKAAMKFNVNDLVKKEVNGSFSIKSNDEKVKITGKHSQLTLKK